MKPHHLLPVLALGLAACASTGSSSGAGSPEVLTSSPSTDAVEAVWVAEASGGA